MIAVPNLTDNLGYLDLVITATKYITLSGGAAFAVPVDPGNAPPRANTYPNGNAAERAVFPFLVQEGIYTFNKRKQNYSKYIATKKLVK